MTSMGVEINEGQLHSQGKVKGGEKIGVIKMLKVAYDPGTDVIKAEMLNYGRVVVRE